MRFRHRLLAVLAVLLPVALVGQTTQASASAAALTIELRSDTAHSVSYSYSPSEPGTYVATVEGMLKGTTIDPTTCAAAVERHDGIGATASVSECAGVTVKADLGASGTDQARVTVYSEGRPIAGGLGTVAVTTEPDPANPALCIVIILIIILLLIPLAAY